MFNKGIKIKEKPGIPKEKVIYFWVATIFVVGLYLTRSIHQITEWRKWSEAEELWEEEIFVFNQEEKKIQEPHEFMTGNIWIYKRKKKERAIGCIFFIEREREDIIPNVSIIIKLATTRENDESNLSITKHRKFMSFLEQTIPPLRESNLPVDLVLYSSQFHSSPPHTSSIFLSKKY